MPWTDDLPEDLKGDETLNRYADVEALARGHLEARARVSQSIRVPPSEAGDDARAEFLNRLIEAAPELTLKPGEDNMEEFYQVMGKPQDAKGYENPEDVASVGDDVEGQIREMSLKANLTQGQYQSLLSDMSSMQEQTVRNLNSAQEARQDELKGEWGMAFDERVGAALKMNEEFFPEVDFSSLSNEEIKGRYEMSTRLSGKGPQAPNQPGAEPSTLSPAEAVRRRAEIMERDEYWDAGHPEHKRLVDRVVELGKLAGMPDTTDDMRRSWSSEST